MNRIIFLIAILGFIHNLDFVASRESTYLI